MPPHSIPLAVVDARNAGACDAAAIASGIPSRALMQRAGAAAAAEIARRYVDALRQGVVVATGPGNNGGDGWVVAHALRAAGVSVRVVECVDARTADAIAERGVAIAAGVPWSGDISELLTGGESVVVDALLGTGLTAARPLRGDIALAVEQLHRLRERGASIVALDVPTGIDATTGRDAGAAPCDLTITFGTLKHGQLVARGTCGAITVVDIGLGAHAHGCAERMQLATSSWFASTLPRISADAHKGTRKKVAIVGGGAGMAGAAILAARAALRSGAGLVKCVVAPESIGAVQEGEPAALAAAWPTDDASLASTILDWADVVLIGPGLGGTHARMLTTQLLGAWRGPVVLDADALNAFAGDVGVLASLIGARHALLTPHPAEFGRLSGLPVSAVLDGRFELPAKLARESGATVLLKGVPTVITSPDGMTRVVAEGTPTLATGGSGDVLGGIAATLLAQTRDAPVAGALAAFAHGRAAFLAGERQVRGFTLDDVLPALANVWSLEPSAARPPVLLELPAVGERFA
ncbi:MAG TPA: NAD(P)H-hydrate dehydratase [Gemmatimonadaceae bacterium]|nr:NAD(P)H-hydrate dehydratase [Gemmatimonadaceae bacterium]